MLKIKHFKGLLFVLKRFSENECDSYCFVCVLFYICL